METLRIFMTVDMVVIFGFYFSLNKSFIVYSLLFICFETFMDVGVSYYS